MERENDPPVFESQRQTQPHEQGVVTQDGLWIVTSKEGGTARVLDARTGSELLKLNGQTRPVKAAAVTGDQARMVTLWDDGTVRVWEVGNGEEVLQLKSQG